jgi:hypothetical protein
MLPTQSSALNFSAALLAKDKAKADAALTALRFMLSRKSSASVPPVRKL